MFLKALTGGRGPAWLFLIIGEYHIIDYIGVICAYSTLINHINVDPREIIVPDSLTKLKAWYLL